MRIRCSPIPATPVFQNQVVDHKIASLPGMDGIITPKYKMTWGYFLDQLGLQRPARDMRQPITVDDGA